MIKNINDESSLSFKIHFYLNLILTCILVYFLSNKIYCRLFNPLQDEINLSQQPIDIIIISIILVLVMIAVFFATKEQMKIDSEFKLGFEKNSQSNKFLSQILNKYKFNDKAEIEKFNYYQEHIEFVRFIASSFFILGLLGSFLGISETIKALSNNGDILNLENIKNALISIQVIFYVSISGLFSALVTESHVQLIYKKIAQLENFVDKEVEKKLEIERSKTEKKQNNSKEENLKKEKLLLKNCLTNTFSSDFINIETEIFNSDIDNKEKILLLLIVSLNGLKKQSENENTAICNKLNNIMTNILRNNNENTDSINQAINQINPCSQIKDMHTMLEDSLKKEVFNLNTIIQKLDSIYEPISKLNKDLLSSNEEFKAFLVKKEELFINDFNIMKKRLINVMDFFEKTTKAYMESFPNNFEEHMRKLNTQYHNFLEEKVPQIFKDLNKELNKEFATLMQKEFKEHIADELLNINEQLKLNSDYIASNSKNFLNDVNTFDGRLLDIVTSFQKIESSIKSNAEDIETSKKELVKNLGDKTKEFINETSQINKEILSLKDDFENISNAGKTIESNIGNFVKSSDEIKKALQSNLIDMDVYFGKYKTEIDSKNKNLINLITDKSNKTNEEFSKIFVESKNLSSEIRNLGTINKDLLDNLKQYLEKYENLEQSHISKIIDIQDDTQNKLSQSFESFNNKFDSHQKESLKNIVDYKTFLDSLVSSSEKLNSNISEFNKGTEFVKNLNLVLGSYQNFIMKDIPILESNIKYLNSNISEFNKGTEFVKNLNLILGSYQTFIMKDIPFLESNIKNLNLNISEFNKGTEFVKNLNLILGSHQNFIMKDIPVLEKNIKDLNSNVYDLKETTISSKDIKSLRDSLDLNLEHIDTNLNRFSSLLDVLSNGIQETFDGLKDSVPESNIFEGAKDKIDKEIQELKNVFTSNIPDINTNTKQFSENLKKLSNETENAFNKIRENSLENHVLEDIEDEIKEKIKLSQENIKDIV